MSSEERVFQRGETVPCYAEVKDWDGEYQTPTSINIDIYTPSNVLSVDGQAMTEIATGRYVYYYNSQLTDSVGWYRIVIVVVDGTGGGAKTTIQQGGFELN